jgi:YqaJ-like viral recombinase domain
VVIIYHDVDQGTDEWLALRCGLLTASEMKLIISPPPKVETRIKKDGTPYKQREWEPAADDEKCRAHLYELAAQRITKYVEPHYISDDMMRGREDEVEARILYAERIAPVRDVGFITNDEWGFTIGYSPDGVIGEDGLIECKSRRQKFQFETIANDIVPDEFVIQIQCGLLVSGRSWCDFVSYCGGMPMFIRRVYADDAVQNAIVAAATAFEERLAKKIADYRGMLASDARLIPTERKEYQDILV